MRGVKHESNGGDSPWVRTWRYTRGGFGVRSCGHGLCHIRHEEVVEKMEETLTAGEWIIWSLVGVFGFAAVIAVIMACNDIVRILFKGGK